MRKIRRKKSQLIIGIISIIVLVLTVGYSFLSAHLMISGLAHITVYWDVHFDNIEVNPDSVSLSSGDYTPTIDSNDSLKLDYKVTLSQPGDFYEFTVDAVNDGSIDAMIDDITPKINNQDISNLPSYLTYSLSYEDDVEIEEHQILNAHSTETVKIRLEVNQLDSSLPQSFEMSFEEKYVKATSAAQRVKHPIPLYSVLENEYNSGSKLVKLYNGDHKDSFTQEPSKNIYYWSTTYNVDGSPIQNKNHIIFANHCWKMIRTTDTGGVKLIYNGEVENDQCLSTRGTHTGFGNRSSQIVNSNYWYGTDFEYDEELQKYRISGTTQQSAIDESTYPNLIGKITCKSTSENGTCSSIYMVDSYDILNHGTYFIEINHNSQYAQYGFSKFNDRGSPAYVGYMYGTVYNFSSIDSTGTQSYTSREDIVTTASGFYSSYKYSKEVIDTGTGYELVNPILGSDIPDGDYSGYCTFGSTATTGTLLYYIVGVNAGTTHYFFYVSYPKQLSELNITIGDSISDNMDGTYSLSGNVISLTPAEWFANYNDYKYKYTCGNTTTTCAAPRFLTSTTQTAYTYINAGEKIVIGKTRNGLSLNDTLVVRKDELSINRNNYSDYKYTCNTNSSTCTESNLRMITQYGETDYKYVVNRYYGTSLTWDGTNYTLVNPIEMENYNNYNNLATHHYFCIDAGATICNKIAYIYHYSSSGSSMSCITLQNGVISVNEAMDEMFANNTTDSAIKKCVDFWYQKYMLDYDSFIEDTIFCNDRSTYELGGWDPNNATTGYLRFNNYAANNNFGCTNVTDQLSVSNTNAKLTYKVGLMTGPEMNMINNYAIQATKSFWGMAPYEHSYNYTRNLKKTASGSSNDYITSTNGIRPVISLIPGIMYSDGDGSMANPYIIKTD